MNDMNESMIWMNQLYEWIYDMNDMNGMILLFILSSYVHD